MREAELLAPMLKIASSRRKLDIKVAPSLYHENQHGFLL